MWQAREQTYPGMILSAAMYEREIEDPPAIKTNHKFSKSLTEGNHIIKKRHRDTRSGTALYYWR